LVYPAGGAMTATRAGGGGGAEIAILTPTKALAGDAINEANSTLLIKKIKRFNITPPFLKKLGISVDHQLKQNNKSKSLDPATQSAQNFNKCLGKTIIPKTSRKHLIPFTVSLAMFMEAVDTNVINTAIPVMAQSFQVNPINLKIALISYLLSLAILIPISGWVADKFGIKRVFIVALAMFTLSSLWCGFATTLPELIIARIIQGLGGSLMLPVARLIIVRNFGRHELIATMNRVVMVGALGLMLGPVLGGFITHYFSWRWIFWVNIPVGILNIVLTWYALVDTPPLKVHPLDKLGFIYFGASLSAFTFSLSELSETSANTSFAFLVMAIATLLFLTYLAHSWGRPHQIVKTSLFKSRPFRISSIGNLISRLGFGGVPFLIPLMLQLPLHYPPQVSGMLIAPMALGVLLIKPMTLPILRFFGYKRLLLLNTALVALMLCSFTVINANTSIYQIGIMVFIFGFLISMQYSSMNSLGYSGLDPENLSAGTSIMSTLQQIAQSFGVAVAALSLRIFSENFTFLTVNVFHDTFIVMGILTLLSALMFMRLKSDDGSEMIAPKVKPSPTVVP
jgi:EmrB/QacA subfamily drug resistance transporter